MHSNAYTFRFAAIVTIVCSVLLASAATLLKPRQEENQKLDARKNILVAIGIQPEEGKSFSRKQINQLYRQHIREFVVNKDGEIVKGKLPDELDPKKDTDLYPLYEAVKNDSMFAYVIPISGKGLWSTIYGYLALKLDCDEILGITFYRHGETPGLGGEISKKWFTDNFKGKHIRDKNGKLVSIRVIKGKVKEKCTPEEADHCVDGISGATLTGRGVTKFFKKELEKYEPFFSKVRSKEGSV
ncbi:MAG TPA: NADH:ubiquinone reductase (Na(+)-transporting) subunit C [Caldithrix abyssi]|uniref:Na(+)-translocating NADH-quinone reductase subunit C n=1 Tax=Caldithrix abyssi TaxID=187145 RepID=A0A7V5PM16_CALAY|nr:NADH:ubiquinone reductase (Na(+)-transporting) subunit C [Caldithrix abyssi]